MQNIDLKVANKGTLFRIPQQNAEEVCPSAHPAVLNSLPDRLNLNQTENFIERKRQRICDDDSIFTLDTVEKKCVQNQVIFTFSGSA